MPLPAELRRILQACPSVPLLSAPIPVASDARYPEEQLPMFGSISTTIKFVGGVNKPKLVGLHARTACGDSRSLSHMLEAHGTHLYQVDVFVE